MKRHCIGALLALVPAIVSAGDDTALDALLAFEGDTAYGEYLAGECTTCHRADGTAEGIPAITGWPSEDFRVGMFFYRNGDREHPVMNTIAKRLGDEEIASLADYFETLSDN